MDKFTTSIYQNSDKAKWHEEFGPGNLSDIDWQEDQDEDTSARSSEEPENRQASKEMVAIGNSSDRSSEETADQTPEGSKLLMASQGSSSTELNEDTEKNTLTAPTEITKATPRGKEIPLEDNSDISFATPKGKKTPLEDNSDISFETPKGKKIHTSGL